MYEWICMLTMDVCGLYDVSLKDIYKDRQIVFMK